MSFTPPSWFLAIVASGNGRERGRSPRHPAETAVDPNDMLQGRIITRGVNMPAYLIADETITNPEAFEEYKRQVLPTISRFGGRFLSRGASYELLEAQRAWEPDRLVIIEFPDMDTLRAWYQSPEYQPIREIRHAAARSTLVALEAGPAVRPGTASTPVGPSLV